MELADLIARDAILPAVKAGSKKQILQEIGARARDAYGLNTRLVVEGLLAREKLGSTAMGGGVAIPHARLEGLKSIAGLFEAVDGQGVDLVFVLLAPEESGADHLRALARVSRLLRDTELRKKLRETSEAAALYALITEPMASRAA
jgi:PTS system nitrogen regulatory IIA component